MKKHKLFLDAYGRIEDSGERRGFLRGYLFALSPKEMTDFMLENFEAGLHVYEQILSTANSQEKSDARKELDEAFALLNNRPEVAI